MLDAFSFVSVLFHFREIPVATLCHELLYTYLRLIYFPSVGVYWSLSLSDLLNIEWTTLYVKAKARQMCRKRVTLEAPVVHHFPERTYHATIEHWM